MLEISNKIPRANWTLRTELPGPFHDFHHNYKGQTLNNEFKLSRESLQAMMDCTIVFLRALPDFHRPIAQGPAWFPTLLVITNKIFWLFRCIYLLVARACHWDLLYNWEIENACIQHDGFRFANKFILIHLIHYCVTSNSVPWCQSTFLWSVQYLHKPTGSGWSHQRNLTAQHLRIMCAKRTTHWCHCTEFEYECLTKHSYMYH